MFFCRSFQVPCYGSSQIVLYFKAEKFRSNPAHVHVVYLDKAFWYRVALYRHISYLHFHVPYFGSSQIVLYFKSCMPKNLDPTQPTNMLCHVVHLDKTYWYCIALYRHISYLSCRPTCWSSLDLVYGKESDTKISSF